MLFRSVNKAGAFAENLAQGAAREVLVAERVERERALLLGDFTAPIARSRCM